MLNLELALSGVKGLTRYAMKTRQSHRGLEIF